MLVHSRLRRCLVAGGLLLSTLVWTVPASTAQQFSVRHYTVDEGLPSGLVRDIHQGPGGEMWFATRSGVARYDGTKWTVYNLRDGFRAADQLGLAWDGEGTLWSITTQAPFDLYWLDAGAWHSVPGPGADADGRTATAFGLIDTPRGPGFLLGTDDGFFFRIGNRVGSGAGSEWRHWSVASGLLDARVIGVVVDDGVMVVGTEAGLTRFDGDRLEAMGPATLPGPLAAFAREPEPTGRWWLAGAGWTGTWRPGNPLTLVESTALGGWTSVPRQNQRVALAPDRRGGAYVARNGVWSHVVPSAAADTLSGPFVEGLTQPDVMFVDREHTLWVGGHGRISKLVRRPFARLSRRHGLLENDVTAIAARADGSIVLGHRGGLTMLAANGRVVEARPWPESMVAPRERVWDLAIGSGKDVLIAGGRNGLGRLASDGTLRWLGPEAGLAESVTSVASGTDGVLWVGTERGLMRAADTGGYVAAGDGTEAVHIRSLTSTRHGGLLLSTVAGLMGYEAGVVTRWPCRVRVGCNSVFAALERPGGAIWVGTSGGLFQTVGGQLVPVAEPTIDRPIYSLFHDRDGDVWFGTDNGVLRWDDESLRPYTTRDGLAGREINRAAWQVDPQGRVWVGTESGVSVLNETNETEQVVSPLVIFEHFAAGAGAMPLNEPARLRHDENDLTFRFRALSLRDESRNQVASKLEGFDESWSIERADRVVEARYTNLPPGRYRFHARAANADGVWSAERSSAAIVITKPYWLESWFHVLTVTLLGGLVFWGRRLVSNSQYARRLEREVEERVAEVFTEKERLSVTLRNIDDGVLTTDDEGAVIFLNPVAQELVGYRPGAAIGRPLSEVLRLRLPTGDRAVYDPFALLVARDIEALERAVTAELSPVAGEPRLVEVSGSPIIASHGRLAGLVLAFRDVSERQRIDQELAKGQRLEALGLLAGGIAHDFNNLLTVMLGSLSMVDRTGNMTDQQKKLLRDTESAVLRARDLTRQLLTFSQGGAPVRTAAAIGEVVRESASFVLSGANVRAEIELPNDLWVVEIDAGQISQVLNNLLINATQAMPRGGVIRITGQNALGATIPLPRERYVVLTVVDEGVGIPAEHVDRIFDPYFSTKEQGRGLGLASAYSIAKRHDGLLTVESTLGIGTSFRLFLPASNELALHRAPLPVRDQSRAGRILIMDDDDSVRSMIGAMVRKLGYEVSLTADGEAAVARYAEALGSPGRFDAVIMDLTVRGGMGGKEATERLREIDPRVRAIVASGYSNDPVMSDHGAYGFLGRISKPFPPDELGRVLDEVLAADLPDADGSERGSQPDESSSNEPIEASSDDLGR